MPPQRFLQWRYLPPEAPYQEKQYSTPAFVLPFPNCLMMLKLSDVPLGLMPGPKTVAEKKAWEINKLQSRWDLVTINPSFVLSSWYFSPKYFDLP